MDALIAAPTASPNVVLAVKNPECGNTVYTSGPVEVATRDSLWRIGSVTKTMISATTLTLATDGLLSLDDAIDRFVPGLANTSGVTIRMLLGHRSGIYNYTDDPAFYMHRDDVWTPRQIVDLAISHAPYFAAGEGFMYSNTNYILLGMIIEAATSKPVAQVLHERAIAPAGLLHTFFDGADEITEPLATGYSAGYLDVTYFWHPSAVWTAGAVVASASDLADWLSAVYGTETVLDAAELATLTTDPTTFTFGGAYGLGVQIRYFANAGMALGHDGAIDGYHTYAMYLTDKQTAVAAIVNRDGAMPEPIVQAAMRELF